ncbi:hypothetical protein [Priestia megaterium]|uniref:hypothetical protein n=1 Tax=Priestia megaterium TaxID=1404 RepID=UPI0012BA0E2E|nr:hypothetical protein [Priestia megaterium]
MISESILKNVHKYEIKSFLKRNSVEKIDSRLTSHRADDYKPYSKIIDEEIKVNKINRKLVNEFLCEHICYSKTNIYHIFDLTNFFCFNTITEVQLNHFKSNNPKLLFNNLITDVTLEEEFQLCSTEVEHENDQINQISFLFYLGLVDTRAKGRTSFFSNVIIDVKQKLVFVKFNSNLLENAKYDKLFLINRLLTILTKNDEFQPLSIGYESFNEEKPQKMIFKMFSELSLEAEEILNKKIPLGTDEKIKSFLKDVKISQNEKDYIKQIKAVIYQDLSDNFQGNLFKNGWVFRFVFREKDYTRASSRTDDYSPIYGSKVYWNLKELIFKGKKMNDAGFKWVLPRNQSPILVKLESKNNGIIIQYYNDKERNNQKFRKEKDNFVAQKIRKYLS